MKKLLLSLLTIGLVGGVAFAASQAFFSDTETSTGNIFQAGDIDLKIDNTSFYTNADGVLVGNSATTWELADLTVQKFFNFVDLKPGDIGEDTISVHVGSNDAWLCAAARITDDSDQTCTDPEMVDDSTCTNPGLGQGDLDQAVNFAFWVDDGDNVYEQGESIFLQGPLSGFGANGKITLADSATSVLGNNIPVPGGTTFYIGKAWCFGTLTPNPEAAGPNSDPVERGGTGFTCNGSAVNNAAQTDKVVGDLQFYAEQSRNNSTFTCAQNYTPVWPTNGEVLGIVGADLAEYTVPTNCEHTASPGTFAAEYTATGNGQTLCLDDGTYPGPIVIDKEISLVALHGPTATATINGVVEIKANNVTVKGFEITGGTSTAPNFAGIYVWGNTSGHTLRDNLIDGTDVADSRGILFGYDVSNVLVTNNVIRDWQSGSYINPTTTGNIDFTYNDIESNVVGIGSDSISNVDVNHNEFDGNTVEAFGISSVERNANNNVININNMIPAGAGNDVNEYGGTFVVATVDATQNWWDGEVEASRTNDIVTVDTEPAAAAIYPHN